MIILSFFLQIIIQLTYCAIAYKAFGTKVNFFYIAITAGMISQILWANVVRLSPSHTSLNVYGVFYDSISFLIWGLLPIIMTWSKLNKVGVLGILLIVLGMIILGLRDIKILEKL